MAAMAPDKSRTLHNFSLPSRLNWGTQKLLRCSKSQHDAVSNHRNLAGEPSDEPERKRRSYSPSSIRRESSLSSKNNDEQIDVIREKLMFDHRNLAVERSDEPERKRRSYSPSSIRRESSKNDEQIDVIREKLMFDLRSEVDKMRAAILGNPQIDTPPPPPPPPPFPPPPPWNLRTRRAACKEPMILPPPSLPLGGGDKVVVRAAELSVPLSRKEIEEDFVRMTGRRPARKPKKRPRYVQKQLDTLFPGLWLSEITADLYKVNENPEPEKGLYRR